MSALNSAHYDRALSVRIKEIIVSAFMFDYRNTEEELCSVSFSRSLISIPIKPYVSFFLSHSHSSLCSFSLTLLCSPADSPFLVAHAVIGRICSQWYDRLADLGISLLGDMDGQSRPDPQSLVADIGAHEWQVGVCGTVKLWTNENPPFVCRLFASMLEFAKLIVNDQ